MSEVEQLLVEIGKGIGLSAEQVKLFSTKLEENLFDSKESLKDIDAETWKFMGLPMRLFLEVRK